MNIKSVRLVKRWLPVVPLAFGAAVIIATQNGGSSLKTSVEKADSLATPALATPNPTDTSQVTVNGKAIHLGPGGTADVTLTGAGGSKTHVVASGGNTKISTQSSEANASTKPGTTNGTNVSIRSQSQGGNSSGLTQVYGYSNSSNNNGNSSSFSSNQVFSTGSSNVDVTSP
ncbi:MAG TPA: hypothetical protein VMS08_04330 [Candidatus Saccharimonadia bacterium]|nr:hypothetical protein [Candidatus Saccharimonadia bacterium]